MPRFPFPFPSSPRPRRRYPRRVGLIGAIALLIAAIAGGVQQCHGPTPAGQEPRAPVGAGAPRSAPSTVPTSYAVVGGTAISDPEQVQGIWDTLRRIDKGPPFPYHQDGVSFSNRERRLPKRDPGWWREYTVETPGSSDRGARRLVVGKDGETWYSADHYRSFVRLQLP